MPLNHEKKKELGYSTFEANVVLKLRMDSGERRKVEFVWRSVVDNLRRAFDGVEINVEPEWLERPLDETN